jgi:hypothetical protein
MKRTKTAVWAAWMAVSAAAAWGGSTAWDRDMAGRLRPEMPGAKTRAEWRNARGWTDRSSSAWRTAAAEAAAATPGLSLPDGVEWRTAFESEEERVEVAEFTDGKGRTNRFAVYEQLGNPVPYYWTVEGGDAAEAAAGAKAVWEAEGVLERANTEMAELGREVAPPYERFRFRVLDDAPELDWVRPCRYVFEDADGSGYTVMWKRMPPQMRNRATKEEIPWKGTTREVVPTQAPLPKERARETKNAAEGGREVNPGGVTARYVLFSGGANAVGNGIRFWSDTAMLYSTLTKTYGVPKDRITVLMSDGKNPGEDANLGDWTTQVLVDSPRDLDGDGVEDVDGPARRAALSNCLAGLSRELGPDDQLWVFITSHGSCKGVAGRNNRSATISCWGTDWSEEEFEDEEFAAWTAGIRCPMAVAIETCFAGGFVDDLAAQKDRVVATVSSHYEVSFGRGGEMCWSDGSPLGIVLPSVRGTPGWTKMANSWAMHFIAALRGVMPRNLSGTGFPWQDDDEALASDLNGDGRVSFQEAAAWAAAKDSNGCHQREHAWDGEQRCLWVYSAQKQNKYEHPQYAETRSGLGAEMSPGHLATAVRNQAGEAKGTVTPATGGGHALPIPKAAFKPGVQFIQ